MKTPGEIKKDAETCMNHPYMDTCNSCRLYKECHGISDHIVKELYDLMLYYESRLAQAERERDAAVADLIDDCDCRYCQRKDLPKQCGRGYCSDCDNEKCPCYDCTPKNNNFIWRGVCAENTEVD